MSFAHPNGNQTTFPELVGLYGGRWRATRRVEIRNQAQIVNTLFPAYAAADPATTTAATSIFADLRLIDKRVQPGEQDGFLTLTYETLTTTLVDEVAPVTDYELNGLKRTTRQLIALPGVSTAAYVVGTQTYGTSPVQYLASAKIDASDAYTRITAVYLQPGVVSKSRSPGPVPGTIRNTWQTFRLDPTDAAAMTAAGAGSVIPGIVIEDSDENVQGYLFKRVSTVSGTITGVKTTYPDAVEVEVPGTVSLTTVAITAGGLTGTDAIIQVTPKRVKTVSATVTIEITTAPAGAPSTPAYNLENISCSVTNTRASYSYKGSDIYTTVSGSSSIAVPKYGASIAADISTYPGCYVVGSTTATGSFTYTAGSEASGLGTNSIVVSALTATVSNKLTATGATAATGYSTTGILRRKCREALTALDGTIYWEVVTWSV